MICERKVRCLTLNVLNCSIQLASQDRNTGQMSSWHHWAQNIKINNFLTHFILLPHTQSWWVLCGWTDLMLNYVNSNWMMCGLWPSRGDELFKRQFQSQGSKLCSLLNSRVYLAVNGPFVTRAWPCVIYVCMLIWRELLQECEKYGRVLWPHKRTSYARHSLGQQCSTLRTRLYITQLFFRHQIYTSLLGELAVAVWNEKFVTHTFASER